MNIREQVLLSLANLSGLNRVWISPTVLARTMWAGTMFWQQRRSSWSCPHLKRLCRAYCAERNDDGHYRPTAVGLNHLSKIGAKGWWNERC